MEVFCIDPDTGDDPLSDYFNGAMGFIGGGLGGEQDLSRKPYPINLELNEWKSLPPGSYRLSIVSHRATVPTDNDPSGMGVPPIPLRSNVVEFQVVKADPEWQGEQLAAEGTEKRVWTVRDSHAKNGMRSEAIPAEVKNRFEK